MYPDFLWHKKSLSYIKQKNKFFREMTNGGISQKKIILLQKQKDFWLPSGILAENIHNFS